MGLFGPIDYTPGSRASIVLQLFKDDPQGLERLISMETAIHRDRAINEMARRLVEGREDWVATMTSDDFLAPKAIARAFKMIQEKA